VSRCAQQPDQPLGQRQWYISDTGDTSNPIAGATSAGYSASGRPGTTKYWVRISDSANGSAGPDVIDSQTATIDFLFP
jgi:hypothetical protein